MISTDDMNALAMFVRMLDRLKKEETRRDHLLAGMQIGCSLLTELNRSQRDLATGLDEIDAKTEDAVQLIKGHREPFLGIEDLILRDAGIEDNHAEDHVREMLPLHPAGRSEKVTLPDGARGIHSNKFPQAHASHSARKRFRIGSAK